MKIPIESYARNKIRSEMAQRRITTKQICSLLKDKMYISINEQSFNNKMSRANFSATFFLQCIYVLGIEKISFEINDIRIGVENEDN